MASPGYTNEYIVIVILYNLRYLTLLDFLFIDYSENKEFCFAKQMFIITLKEHFIMPTYNVILKYNILTGNMNKLTP